MAGAKEVHWQAKIVKNLRTVAKGYAKKWATSLSVGVPDLVTVVPPHLGAVFIEVKLEKNLATSWKRKVKLTDKQVHELNALREAGANAIVLIVCHYSPTNVWIVLKDPPKRSETLYVSNVDVIGLSSAKWSPGMDLRGLIENFYSI